MFVRSRSNSTCNALWIRCAACKSWQAENIRYTVDRTGKILSIRSPVFVYVCICMYDQEIEMKRKKSEIRSVSCFFCVKYKTYKYSKYCRLCLKNVCSFFPPSQQVIHTADLKTSMQWFACFTGTCVCLCVKESHIHIRMWLHQNGVLHGFSRILTRTLKSSAKSFYTVYIVWYGMVFYCIYFTASISSNTHAYV